MFMVFFKIFMVLSLASDASSFRVIHSLLHCELWSGGRRCRIKRQWFLFRLPNKEREREREFFGERASSLRTQFRRLCNVTRPTSRYRLVHLLIHPFLFLFLFRFAKSMCDTYHLIVILKLLIILTEHNKWKMYVIEIRSLTIIYIINHHSSDPTFPPWSHCP